MPEWLWREEEHYLLPTMALWCITNTTLSSHLGWFETPNSSHIFIMFTEPFWSKHRHFYDVTIVIVGLQASTLQTTKPVRIISIVKLRYCHKGKSPPSTLCELQYFRKIQLYLSGNLRLTGRHTNHLSILKKRTRATGSVRIYLSNTTRNSSLDHFSQKVICFGGQGERICCMT